MLLWYNVGMTHNDTASRKDFAQFDTFIPLTPADGRYRRYTIDLVNYLSEAALNRERIYVEINWVIALCAGLPAPGFDSLPKPAISGLPTLTSIQKDALLNIVDDFDASSIAWLADKERVTQHDVKAVEYYIKSSLEDLARRGVFDTDTKDKVSQAVHIFCTSEDINNLAYSLCLKNAVEKLWLPKLQEFIKSLHKLALETIDIPLLAKTHGQPATPVTLGKELAVFVHRLQRQVTQLKAVEYLGKINGATGTFSAHEFSAPETNWPKFAEHFVTEYLGLSYNPLTTQIESHDAQAELYSVVAHIGRILHNFATDIWTYISNEVFIQIPVEGATGSSTMPHKINPIKFENAEANLEISNSLFGALEQTLVTSRLQRDLTDSTTQRNIGTAFAHSLIAISNLHEGIAKLEVNKAHLKRELADNPAVLGEAIQSVMRAQGIAGEPGMESPYERLKEFTRGKDITLDNLHNFIKDVGFKPEIEAKLLRLTPETYTGLAINIAEDVLKEVMP
jgi:adenylosuccinate lyase